jgi:hypothetical protein
MTTTPPRTPADQVDPSATIRLTYKELAERLGITPDPARLKARGRWRVDKGNDGRSWVTVPLAELAPRAHPGHSGEDSTTLARATPEATPEPSGEWASVVQGLQDDLAAAREDLALARERAAVAEARAALIEAERERDHARITHLEATVDDLRRPWLARLWRAIRDR